MLQTLMHAVALLSCLGAAMAAARESWRPVPPGRWAARLTTIASVLVFLDWLILIVRDWHLTTLADVLVASMDAFIIVLGIAWIPCFLLLRIRLPVLRAASYIVGCVIALVWIAWHIPTHAVAPRVRADTAAMSVAVPLIGFAFLNLVLIVLRARKPGRPDAGDASQVRLAWGTAAAACVSAIAAAAIMWRAV